MSINRDSNFSTQSTESKNKVFYKLKLILIGDSGVGKTSLLRRYMDEAFLPNNPCTINADYKIKSLAINPYTTAELTIWDTCGQERFRSITRQYFKDAHGVILMYDVSDKRSFGNLDIWLEEIKKNKDDVSIILCGNKIDLNYRNITYEEAEKFAKDNDILYCETSSKEGTNIESAFENVTKDIIDKMGRKTIIEKDFKNVSLNSSTRGVRGKERKREKEVKCC